MPELAERKREQYSEEDIERGLQALAIAGSSFKAEQQTGILATTLRNWKAEHAERYHQIRADVLPRIQAQIAAESEDLTRRYAALEHQAIDKAEATLDQLDPKDIAGAARNYATARGISTDKAMAMRGMPTQIIEHRSPDSILKQLAARYGQAIDTTATEMEPPALPAERLATANEGQAQGTHE